MSARIFSRSRSSWQSQGGLFGRLLDPIDRLAQTIYSVLILLTFTLAFRVFDLTGQIPDMPSDEQIVSELLLAAIGATIAWGVIDAIMYLLLELFQRSERHRLLQQIQAAPDPSSGIALVAEELDYVLDPITEEDERYQLYQNVYQRLLESEPRPVGLRRDDLTGALGTLIVTLLAVVPSLLPLILFRHNTELAIRTSNIVSFIVLFLAGYSWGRHTGSHPLRTGILLAGVGAIMVLIAIPLGG
ncbi:MAG: hypothetical protein AB4911_03325 [Oscillochloridaceae bacterium umkhey_bin13]